MHSVCIHYISYFITGVHPLYTVLLDVMMYLFRNLYVTITRVYLHTATTTNALIIFEHWLPDKETNLFETSANCVTIVKTVLRYGVITLDKVVLPNYCDN